MTLTPNSRVVCQEGGLGVRAVQWEDRTLVLPLSMAPSGSTPLFPVAHQLLSQPTPGEGNVLRGRPEISRSPAGRCTKPS